MTVTDKQKANLQLLKDTDNPEVQSERGKVGGKSKSESKRLHCIINGLLQKKDLTPETIQFIALVKEGKISELVKGLLSEIISINLTKNCKPKDKDKVLFYNRMAIIEKAMKIQESERQIAPTNLTQINIFGDIEEWKKTFQQELMNHRKQLNSVNSGSETPNIQNSP